MSQSTTVRRMALLLVASLALSGAALAQDPNNPVGHWVAEHPTAGGIGTWWDFRTDGNIVIYQGAMVTSKIGRAGDTITLPPVKPGADPTKIKFNVEADTLHLISPTGTDVAYSRVGAAPSETDTLLGKWRPVPPKTPNPDPKIAAQERSAANALYVFGADNTYTVRIPFNAHRGTWDAKAHTFQIQGDPGTYKFKFDFGKLALSQPPDGKKTDTYIPDPLM
jgi:hypothetical protein